MHRVVIIDYNDSFTYTLARYFKLLGAECEVVSYETVDLSLQASHLVLSPGPGSPSYYPKSKLLLDYFIARIPVLGVCLGHQIICEYYGCPIKRAYEPVHGIAVAISHNGLGLFKGLGPMHVGCYNSLVVNLQSENLFCCARNARQEVMAVQHRNKAVFGLQFHPESVNTCHGISLLENFLGTEC